MNYNLNTLSNVDFEHLSQSLSKCLLGNGVTSFGDGPDGGREATFEGEANYPNDIIKWGGYWVIQAKYRRVRTESESKDFDWLKKEIYKELKKYSNRKTKVKIPDNLIFFTNIILTPAANVGGRDKADSLIKELEKKYQIDHIAIISFDDINDLLNKNRDVAISFSGFILPGDILNKLYELLNKERSESCKLSDYIGRYLEIEFRNNLLSKLEHAGKLTSDKINLEKVFIDLYATNDGSIPKTDDIKKFISKSITIANHILKPSVERQSRFVLIAGPGYGKSTLTQYLSQVYRAYFLKNIDTTKNILPEVDELLNDLTSSIDTKPSCVRLPFRIILKDYASWIIDQTKKDQPFSIMEYLKWLINKRCNDNYVTGSHIEDLLLKLPTVIIFDGLDEVPSSSNRQEVLNEINTFTDIILRRADADALIIGTSRPQGYLKEFNSTAYKHLIITDLKPDDCLDYITKLLKNIEEDSDKRRNDLNILKKAINDPIVGRLMKSPLQASIMTILVRSGGEPPRNKYELFSEYYSTIFRREKQKNISRILNENSPYIDEIHNKLGYTLQLISESKDSPSATITIPVFKTFVDTYLSNDIELKEVEVPVVSAAIIEAVTNRLVFIEEVQDNQIGFNIRSIQEYFAANYFMQNRPDKIIPECIKAIGTSSYWNNTLLFSIGYLFKQKKYAIDHVETISNQLNGSEQGLTIKSLTSIYKHGSWLSLDLLNEGTFRGYPRFENKFSRILEDLFRLPFIPKHRDVLKLPEIIKKEWVMKYVTDNLSNSDTNIKYTGWILASLLIKTDNLSFPRLVESWDFDKSDSKTLLGLLAKNRVLNKTLITDILFEKIRNSGPLEYFEILTSPDVLSILSEIIEKIGDPKIYGEILTCLFVADFYPYVESDSDELKILQWFLKNENTNNRIFPSKGEDHLFEFWVIENGYTGGIGLIFRTDKEYWKDFLKKFEPYESELLKNMGLFYLNPCLETLVKFITTITNVSPNSQKVVKNHIAEYNWLFREILFSDFKGEELLHKISGGHFGDEKFWKLKEAGFEEKVRNNDVVDLMSNLSFGTLRLDRADLIKRFIEKYHPIENQNRDLLYELLRLSSWLLIDDYKDYVKVFDNDFGELMLLSFEKVYLNQGPKDFDYSLDYSIYTLILSLSPEIILNNLDTLDRLFEFINLKSTAYISSRQSERMDQIFKKIVDLYPAIYLHNPNSSIIRLIPNMLSHENLSVSVFKLKDINFYFQYDATKLNPANKFSFACFLLLNSQSDESKSQEIEEILNQLEFTDEMVEVFFKILEKFNFTKNLDSILLSMEKKINSYTLKSLYINITKGYIENQLSEIRNLTFSKS